MNEVLNLGKWISLKNKYKIGELVKWTIEGKTTFGCFINIGEEFPGLLQIVSIKDLNYDKFLKNKIYNVGEKIKCYVLGFRDYNFQIELSEFSSSKLKKEYWDNIHNNRKIEIVDGDLKKLKLWEDSQKNNKSSDDSKNKL